MKFLIKKKMLFLGGILAFHFTGLAQMINEGDLYIDQNTVVSSTQVFKNTSTGIVNNDGNLLLYDGLDNDGLFSFTPGITTSRVEMLGLLANQSILGTRPIEFYDLVLNNTNIDSEILVTNSIDVFGKVFFEAGVLNNNNLTGFVTFQPNSSAVNYTDKSYVEGFVKKYGGEQFLYPIGSERHLNYVELLGDSKNVYSFKHELKDSNLQYPHNKKDSSIDYISKTQYWIVNIENKTNEDKNELSFYFNADTEDSELNDLQDELHVVAWDVVQNVWVDLGGNYNSGKKEIRTDKPFPSSAKVFAFAKAGLPISAPKEVTVYNGLTPNDDGKNDFLYIEGIDKFPNNSVEVYNRWGMKVYSKDGYDNDTTTSFDGSARTSFVVNQSSGLPEGVYFYIIRYRNTKKIDKTITGYLYINR